MTDRISGTPKSTRTPPPVVPASRRWASDVIVDLLHRYRLPYAALNPGASYRGLHDSIVNYGQNYPTMMLCQHQETAVQVAHGYAKASGRPMVAIVHNLVGIAGLLGAKRVATLAHEITLAFRSGADDATIAALVNSCDSELAYLTQAVRALPPLAQDPAA